MRREFQLPEEDIAGLDARGLKWEAIKVGDAKWIIFRDYPIPEGYKVRFADMALSISPSYPDTQIDMANFFPALELVSGKVMQRLTPVNIEGKQYQQWSRHRTQANPWRIGLDSVCSHILLVDTWLQRELSL